MSRLCFVVAALASGLSAVAGEVDLSTAEIYVSTNATCPEVEAAKMLIRAQKMVAGGVWEEKVEPKTAAEWPKSGVVIGWQESALLAPKAKELGLKPWRETKNLGDTIVQRKVGDVYVIAGNSPEGAFYSVADVLYANGARCIHMGGAKDNYASGLYLEWMKALKAPEAKSYTPVVALRTGFASREGNGETGRIAANLFAVMNGGAPEGPLEGGHARRSIGCEAVQPPVNDFKKHPDWFPLVDGKRWRPVGGWCWIVNGCFMSEEFKQWVVDHETAAYRRHGGANMITDSCLTDSDGGQDCQCEGCKKLRADYPGSDWYWKTLGEINAKIRARIPDLRNYTFAYGHGHDIPTDKSLVKYLDAIQYCPHGRCYVHPYSVKCPTNRADLDRCEAWQAADIPIGDFDYCYDVFQPSMNMPSWNVTWDVVRYFKVLNGEKGVPSIYMEAANHPKGCGGKSRASVYVVARAAWEGATTPAAEHLKDFVRCAYGDPAKEAFAADSPEKLMLDWYEACAAAWGAQKTHLTATFNNPTGTAKTYFSEELEKSGAKAFAAAEQAIRVRMASEGTPVAKMTRAQYLAWKQYETWAFEKRFAYDAWKELRDKAMSSSMTVNLELAGEDDAEFDRMPTLATRQTQWVTKGIPSNDVPRVTLKLYRTDKALRARFTVNAPAYRTLAPADCKEGGFAFGLDHVELFLQAPCMSDYYHLAARPDGTRYDALCKDSSFNSDKWRCTTRQREGFVEYDVTVAWDLFGAGYRPKPGDCIKFLAAVSAAVPLQKSGLSQVYSGFPREAAFHDLGVAADLLIDDNAGRRAGGK